MAREVREIARCDWRVVVAFAPGVHAHLAREVFGGPGTVHEGEVPRGPGEKFSLAGDALIRHETLHAGHVLEPGRRHRCGRHILSHPFRHVVGHVRRVARGSTTKTLARVRPLEIVQRRRGAEKILVGGGGRGRGRLRRQRRLILLHVGVILDHHHLHLLLLLHLLRRFGRDPDADPDADPGGFVGGSGGIRPAGCADAHLRIRIRRFTSEEGEEIGVARERGFQTLRRRRGFRDADDGADGSFDRRRRIRGGGGERP